MSGTHRKVLLGLRLSSIGLTLVAAAAVLMTALTLYVGVYYTRDAVLYQTAVTMLHAIQLGCCVLLAVGLVTEFVGHCLCLSVPAMVRTAPARIGLAVVFEACGLLSGTLLFVAVYLFTPIPRFVFLPALLFTLLTGYFSQVYFLRFAYALAEHAAPPLLPEVVAVQRLYLYAPGGFLLAFGVRTAGTLIGYSSGDWTADACTKLIAWLINTAAAVFSLYGVWRWAGMLAGLRKAAARTDLSETPAADDDPDREYREQYEQRVGLEQARLAADD